MIQFMIVEDDRELNRGSCRALKAKGRRMISCPNLKTAREQLRCGNVSSVLLNINLPDGSGTVLYSLHKGRSFLRQPHCTGRVSGFTHHSRPRCGLYHQSLCYAPACDVLPIFHPGYSFVLPAEKLRVDSGQEMIPLFYLLDTADPPTEAAAGNYLAKRTGDENSGLMYESKANLRAEYEKASGSCSCCRVACSAPPSLRWTC